MNNTSIEYHCHMILCAYLLIGSVTFAIFHRNFLSFESFYPLLGGSQSAPIFTESPLRENTMKGIDVFDLLSSHFPHMSCRPQWKQKNECIEWRRHWRSWWKPPSHHHNEKIFFGAGCFRHLVSVGACVVYLRNFFFQTQKYLGLHTYSLQHTHLKMWRFRGSFLGGSSDNNFFTMRCRKCSAGEPYLQ